MHLKTSFSTKTLLWMSFLIPFLLLTVIYASLGTYPFGTGSLLTIDLGQQYVDFFAYFRHTVLNEPSAIFYSFSKSIGGDMLGLWAYYLTSPFNVLLLAFPKSMIAFAVTLIILLKISLTSVTMCYLFIKQFHEKNLGTLLFALSYGLMSYMTVNQFNVIWLDGMLWLPIIILGLNRLIASKRPMLFVCSLAIAVFSNYYIGYMICLFLALVFPYLYLAQKKFSLRDFFANGLRFAGYSVLSMGTISFLLLPTFYSLLGGKGSYQSLTWSFKSEYNPLLMLSKFYFGSFDFDQMPHGYPNLFIGAIALFCFLHYFFSRSFKWSEKVYLLLVILFLGLSMNIEILDKLWHAGQFPIWYNYRFSFVVCFLMVYVGYRWFLTKQTFSLRIAIILLSVLLFNGVYFVIYPQTYLPPVQLLAGSAFAVVALIGLLAKKRNLRFLLFLAICELGVSSTINLSRLSYVQQPTYYAFQQMMTSWATLVKPEPNQFYRVEKTFQRSKNDAMQNALYGIDHFASTFEKEIPTIMGSLGISEGSGFTAYANGTLATDALFGIRYLIQHNSAVQNEITASTTPFTFTEEWMRADANWYTLFTHKNEASILQNTHALSLAYPIDTAILDTKEIINQPIRNQETLLHLLDTTVNKPYFNSEAYKVSYENIVFENSTYKKEDTSKPASVTLTFTPQTDNPYYITVDSRLTKEDVTLRLNGNPYPYYKVFRHTPIFSVASKEKGQELTFTFELKKDSLTMRDPILYHLDAPQLNQTLSSLKEQELKITQFSPTQIKGTATIKKDSTMLTTIPYSIGWQVTVDGHKVETSKVLDSLLAFKISSGTHEIEYHYETPYFWLGCGISLVSLILLLISEYIRYNHTKKIIPFENMNNLS